MAKMTDEKREELARKFVTKSKSAFSQYIERDKVQSVGISSCEEKDGAYEFTGPLNLKSPTGKEKTFEYTAKVNVDEKGKCSFSEIKVREF